MEVKFDFQTIMPDGDLYELTFVQTLYNTRISNIFCFEQDGPDTSDNVRKDIADAFEAQMANLYADALAVPWSATCYEVKLLGVTGQQFFQQLAGPINGTDGTNALNAATVATIATFTAEGGRRGTGRTFISGLDVSKEQRNNLTQEGVESIEPIGAKLQGSLTSGGTQFVFGRCPGEKKDEEGNVIETWPFAEWTISDERIPLTKLRNRRQTVRC